MSTDGLDIRFFHQVNRSMSAVYAGLLAFGVTAAAGAGAAAARVDAPWPLIGLAGLAGAILGLALARATVVRRFARTQARRVTRHCVESGLDEPAVARVLQDDTLVFVADLFARHGASPAPASEHPVLAGDGTTD